MNKIFKFISFSLLGLLMSTNLAYASTVGGDIGTGVDTGISGTVITAPTANVPAGTYTSVQNVSLAAIGSQNIHYSTDGINPVCTSGNVYSAPVEISASETLKAIACYGNNITSAISSFIYVINLPTYPVPTASPLAGTYTSAQSVVLSATGATSIHYTTDNTAPVCSTGNSYSTAILVSSTQTIKAIACYGENSSDVVSFVYTINIQTQTSTGGGGGGGGGGSFTTPAVTTLPSSVKVGDINVDTHVDEYDFAMMMADWGTNASSSADLNKDGTVDEYDFALMMANWGI